MTTGLGTANLSIHWGSLKSLTSLWSVTASELAVRCCTSAALDITTVKSRTEHEGLWFLAVTLADFGKAFQRWLDQGFVVPSDVSSFRRAPHRTGLPAFLSGFLGRVFDPASGVLLDEYDIEAIYAVRQLTLYFSKIAQPAEGVSPSSLPGSRKVVSDERKRAAMSDYIQCESEVRASGERLFDHDWSDFKRISEMLFGSLFSKLDRMVHYGEIVPKHGPGTVADKLSSNAKWTQRSWPARLWRSFPPEEFLLVNCKDILLDDQSSRLERFWEELTIPEPETETPVRVIAVPKTIKTPRIIAIEPTAMQYAQQAVFRAFRDCLQEDGILSAMVGIEDQTPNRDLARRGSLSGDLATLDLSEASDRVSLQHVRVMLEGYADLSSAVFSSRSQKAAVPEHGIIPLFKFASMGSALCFPVEAMVFLTVIFIGIERELRTPLTRGQLSNYLGRVRVFGDDLIVPRDYVLSVVHELENFGFLVNVSKSYWTGRFRESCGKEYFDGNDVSIVKVREVFPTSRQDANEVMSIVSLRNQAYWAGLWKTADWLDSIIRKLLSGVYPNVAPTSSLLGRESALGYQFQRLDPNTHSPLTKGYYVRAKSPIDHLEGEGALLKCMIREPQGPRLPYLGEPQERTYIDVASIDDQHLERSGRPEHVSIKLGWRSPF